MADGAVGSNASSIVSSGYGTAETDGASDSDGPGVMVGAAVVAVGAPETDGPGENEMSVGEGAPETDGANETPVVVGASETEGADENEMSVVVGASETEGANETSVVVGASETDGKSDGSVTSTGEEVVGAPVVGGVGVGTITLDTDVTICRVGSSDEFNNSVNSSLDVSSANGTVANS
jgi:hypothetical protein